METDLSAEARAEILEYLQEAAAAQAEFWDALSRLETSTGIEEINLDNEDLSNYGDNVELFMVSARASGFTEDDCTCTERSWVGSEHDSACPLTGRPRQQ